MTRSKNRALHAALLAGGMGFCLSGVAQAQDMAAPAEPAPAPGPMQAVVSEPPPEVEAHAVEEPPPANEGSWTDNLSVGAFVDAYGALRSDNNASHDKNAGTTAISASDPTVAAGTNNPGVVGAFAHDAYVEASGFALAFAGADIAYSGEEFGATISLRFGPGVNRFYGADQGMFGIDNITQAYATWKPSLIKGLTLDLGQFYTLYGAEVAESWRNMNYSRGGLYYAMQPFWHTGLRANYVVNDKLALNAMVVNGVNTAFEGNKAPTVGVQAVITPMDELFIAAGYMTGLTPRDGDDETSPTKNFQDFFDVVATVTVGNFKVVTNADVNIYRPKGVSKKANWWGISVAPGYSFTNWLGAAARVEFLSDSSNRVFGMYSDKAATPIVDKSVHVTTLTGTVDIKPVPNSGVLIIRPEFRYELASDYMYSNHDNELTKHFYQAVLGVVVTSM